MNRIKKGDTVKVILGKDRGKTGRVLRVFTKENKAMVEGLNLFKKNSKPRRQGEKGEIITISRPITISNLMPICSSCNKAVRIGSSQKEGEMRSRMCKKCGNIF